MTTKSSTFNMARQQSPYTSRYKKSMGSPQAPKNPFQRPRRSLSFKNNSGISGILPSRYSSLMPHSKEGHFVLKAFKQACIIIVAGTILVTLLSVAIPPAPASSRMAAPRPQEVTSNAGALRAHVRKRGGVRSQSRVRTGVKKAEDGRQSLHNKHHWDADTLEHGDEGNVEGASSEESLSQQQLAAEVESKTKKQNAAADGVFGRTNDGDENTKNKKKDEAATKPILKGHVTVDALDSNDRTESDADKSKTKQEKEIDENKDEKPVQNEEGKDRDDAEKALEKSAEALAEVKLLDGNKSVDDSSGDDDAEDKSDAFGKEDAARKKKKVAKVDDQSEAGGSKHAVDNSLRASKRGYDSNEKKEKIVSKDDKGLSSKENADQVNESFKAEEKKAVKVDEPKVTGDTHDESKGGNTDDSEVEKNHESATDKASDASGATNDEHGHESKTSLDAKEKEGGSKVAAMAKRR